MVNKLAIPKHFLLGYTFNGGVLLLLNQYCIEVMFNLLDILTTQLAAHIGLAYVIYKRPRKLSLKILHLLLPKIAQLVISLPCY